MTIRFGHPEPYRHQTRVLKIVEVDCGDFNWAVAICACTCGVVFADDAIEWDHEEGSVFCPRCEPDLAAMHNTWARPDWVPVGGIRLAGPTSSAAAPEDGRSKQGEASECG